MEGGGWNCKKGRKDIVQHLCIKLLRGGKPQSRIFWAVFLSIWGRGWRGEEMKCTFRKSLGETVGMDWGCI